MSHNIKHERINSCCYVDVFYADRKAIHSCNNEMLFNMRREMLVKGNNHITNLRGFPKSL